MLEPARADEYFALHLKRGEWEAKSEPERTAALAMAEQDVSLELGGSELDYANLLAVAAVCEQALFLLVTPDASAEGTVQTETIEGIGSRTFRYRASPAISCRAERFIVQLRGCPGIVRTARG